MMRGDRTEKFLKPGSRRGFSLLEMLVSVMVITVSYTNLTLPTI